MRLLTSIKSASLYTQTFTIGLTFFGNFFYREFSIIALHLTSLTLYSSVSPPNAAKEPQSDPKQDLFPVRSRLVCHQIWSLPTPFYCLRLFLLDLRWPDHGSRPPLHAHRDYRLCHLDCRIGSEMLVWATHQGVADSCHASHRRMGNGV